MKSKAVIRAIKSKQSISPKAMKRFVEHENAKKECDRKGHDYVPHPTMKGITYCKRCGNPKRK